MSPRPGTITWTGISLPQNPPYTQTYRDFSSTRTCAADSHDLFKADKVAATPWISEYTHSLSSPEEYQGRVASMTLVHTGGNTDMAHTTHHTVTRPKFPPGTIDMGTYTISRYLPTADPALEELHQVCDQVKPHVDDIIASCDKYHIHCPKDGWITTTGFVVAANKAGLHLTRAQFLALERAVPKDSMGRINYLHVQKLVQHVTGGGASETQ